MKRILFALLLLSTNAYATTIPVGGSQDVDSAGTAEALASSGRYRELTVCAKDDNTGSVWVGGSAVLAASENGIELNPGDCRSYDAMQTGGVLTAHYVDAGSSSDGVTFEYLKDV